MPWMSNVRGTDELPYNAPFPRMSMQQQLGELPLGNPRVNHLDQIEQPVEEAEMSVLSHSPFKEWAYGSDPTHSFLVGEDRRLVLGLAVLNSLRKRYDGRKDIVCIRVDFCTREGKTPLDADIWVHLTLQLLQNQDPTGIALELQLYAKQCVADSGAIHASKCLELFKDRVRAFTRVYLIFDGLANCPNSPDEATQHVVQVTKELPDNVRTLITWITKLEVVQEETSHPPIDTPQNRDFDDQVNPPKANLHTTLVKHQSADGVAGSASHPRSASNMSPPPIRRLNTSNQPGNLEAAESVLGQREDDLTNFVKERIEWIYDQARYKRDLAKHVLTWIVHAKVNLTSQQIEDSFAIHQSIKAPWRSNERSVGLSVSVCAGLVVRDTTDGTLRLFDNSVKRYLESSNLIYKNADLEIAKTCIHCLLEENSSVSLETPLFEYASKHWSHHFAAEKAIDPNFKDLVKEFFINKDKSARALWNKEGIPAFFFEGITRLHLAVFYNLRTKVEALIESGVDIDAQSNNGQTALHWAVTRDRPQLVEYLIREHANPELSDELGDTPMDKCLSMQKTPSNHRTMRSLLERHARLGMRGASGAGDPPLAGRDRPPKFLNCPAG
ncbi:hypothetical protein CEP53_005406 [Fusarium sp. AF-6]|nr:hypothetical protein CEP53_005406 [Fusarium sp. AF-6]